MRRSRFTVLRSRFAVLLALAIAGSLLMPAHAAARSFLWKVTGKNGDVRNLQLSLRFYF